MKTRKKNHLYRKKSKTRKQLIRKKVTKISNNTPKIIMSLSNKIYNIENKCKHNGKGININASPLVSYTPSINQQLVSLKSASRMPLIDCNTKEAFKMKEPLKIQINEDAQEKKICVPYFDEKAKLWLLQNLKANKHVKFERIIPPIQSDANCWFNTMFVTLFVSDKGRKFFHFFRQLMIEGKQSDGTPLSADLANAFALFNFAIDACLTGNKYAYKLNTNPIIKEIYNAVPDSYKETLRYIRNVGQAGNPLNYYMNLISFLNNHDLEVLFMHSQGEQWLSNIQQQFSHLKKPPHCIIIEIFDNDAVKVKNKQLDFTIDSYKYSIDSVVIRDIDQNHFSSLLTCEKEDIGYDGMSFHRLVKMKWRPYLNINHTWGFKESRDIDNKLLKWNFQKSYQLLVYYRVK